MRGARSEGSPSFSGLPSTIFLPGSMVRPAPNAAIPGIETGRRPVIEASPASARAAARAVRTVLAYAHKNAASDGNSVAT